MAVQTKRRWMSLRLRSTLKGLAFISPWILGYLAFTLYPIAASGYYSLMRYDVIRPAHFIGMENYVEAFTKDETFQLVIRNTLFMVIIGVPLALTTAFLLAALLNNKMKARPVFRTIFFMPTLLPAVVTAEVWRWVFNTNWGLVNSLMKGWGQPVIPFLSSESMAKPSLVIIQCWSTGTAMMIFLAALQDVPRSLYDASVVDGANAVQRFIHVTIPMCTPAILFVMLTSMIGTFQYFAIGWLLTQGGPNRATEFFSIYLYRNAFVFFKMGYASALAWILFLIILGFTVLIFRSSARWVYYGGEAH
jgi:multiple sugar transport system permease protein